MPSNYVKFILSFMLIAIFLTTHELKAKTYKVYFLGGQSNMNGYGYLDDLPDELRTTIGHTLIFQGNTALDGAARDGRGVWATLRPGHGVGFASDGKTNTYSNRFGVELTFAQRLLELAPDQHIAIIKYAKGGTSIDTAAAALFGCWEPDYSKGNGINQYDHFLATIENAFAVSDVDGDGEQDTLIPTAIIWMQGESDAAHTQGIASRYGKNLKRLIDLIRAALRTDDLPVVVGRISESGQAEDGRVWEHGDVVRMAQYEFVQTDACATLVTTTDDYVYSDPWHYDSAGYLALGHEFANAVIRLLMQ